MRLVWLAAAALLMAGCATPGTTTDNDPYSEFNRDVLAFNLKVDRAVLKPVADAYVAVNPKFGRDRVSDFLSNLGSPVTLVNDILQAEPGRALDTSYRLLINTTIGVGGLFDAAEYFGIEGHKEDFGQTLAVWGVDSGPYLVLPLLGPTNPRDLVGFGVDRAFDPLNYAQFEGDTTTRITLGALGGASGRAKAEDAIDTLRRQPEPYVALKRTIIQQRNSAIRNGQDDPDPYQNLPDFDEYE